MAVIITTLGKPLVVDLIAVPKDDFVDSIYQLCHVAWVIQSPVSESKEVSYKNASTNPVVLSTCETVSTFPVDPVDELLLEEPEDPLPISAGKLLRACEEKLILVTIKLLSLLMN